MSLSFHTESPVRDRAVGSAKSMKCSRGVPQHASADSAAAGGNTGSLVSINALGETSGYRFTGCATLLDAPAHSAHSLQGFVALNRLSGKVPGIDNAERVSKNAAVGVGRHAPHFSGGTMSNLDTIGGVDGGALGMDDAGQLAILLVLAGACILFSTWVRRKT